MKKIFALFLAFLLTASPAWAAPAFDSASCDNAQGTGDLTWDHTPVGTPKGVIVLIAQNSSLSDDQIDGVTYGGATLGRIQFASTGASTEPGATYIYFLGSSVPTGTQTVAIDADAGGANKFACVITLTATNNTEVEGSNKQESGSAQNPSFSITTGVGVETFVAGVLYDGHADVSNITPGADYTEISEPDFGSQMGSFMRRTSNDAGSNVTVNWTTTSADDVAAAGIAVKESAPPADPQAIAPIIIQ